MWKTIATTIAPVLKATLTLTPESVLQQQLRTTFILKRRVAPYAHRQGAVPKRLRNRHYIYDLVKDTNLEKVPDMEVILTSYVAGIGNVGDRVSVRPNYAYNSLLLPGLAVYASPENVEKFKGHNIVQSKEVHSSATSQRTVNCLSRLSLSVVMSKENEWTLKPWHLKASFRKSGYCVPVETIALPEKPIQGPNLELENKEFFITVTVNNLEKVNVRCRIHHWATDTVDRIPHIHDFFKVKPDLVFPEDAPVLDAMYSRHTGVAAPQ